MCLFSVSLYTKQFNIRPSLKTHFPFSSPFPPFSLAGRVTTIGVAGGVTSLGGADWVTSLGGAGMVDSIGGAGMVESLGVDLFTGFGGEGESPNNWVQLIPLMSGEEGRGCDSSTMRLRSSEESSEHGSLRPSETQQHKCVRPKKE